MVCTQQTVREAVEGTNPHAALTGADQLVDTVAHFCRRFIGKCDGHNRIRRALFYRQQPRYAVNQHAGFATACSGQHQQIAARRGHGFTLFFIQAVEQVRNVHRHRLSDEKSTHAKIIAANAFPL